MKKEPPEELLVNFLPSQQALLKKCWDETPEKLLENMEKLLGITTEVIYDEKGIPDFVKVTRLSDKESHPL